MINLLHHSLENIQGLAKAHRVKYLWVFGSAAQESGFDQESDVDFLVDFLTIDSGREYLDHFYGLKHDLGKLLCREVDLVEMVAFRNPIFLKELLNSRHLLYESTEEPEKVSG